MADRTGARVLVVEDDTEMAELLCDVLSLAGHVVDAAHTGRGAVGRVHEDAPEIVVCDIGLPDVSGIEVAHAIRATRDDIWIVALTGAAEPGVEPRLRASGFDVVLTKPIELRALQDVIADLAGRARPP
jgi:CheY-like chemotaxis protein